MTRPRRVAIVGSRINIPNDASSEERKRLGLIRDTVACEVEAFVWTLPIGSVVITGGARDVDTFAEEAAMIHLGYAGLIVHRADWDAHGKSAGMRRNPLIVNDCSELEAWWDGRSRGTANSIELARDAGKPVTIHRFSV